MNWKNPTAIKIGMRAPLSGHVFQVIGRAELGVQDAGKFCRWHEYYLKADTGEISTLVYEKRGLTGEWRWFTQFDPTIPLSAGDAASKRVGDYVSLDEHSPIVKFVNQSRVYHVEGHAPEGVRAGAQANYFNAKEGTSLFVVSWTGDEVEYYRGINLTRRAVAKSFKLGTSRLVPAETILRFALVGLAIFAVVALISLIRVTTAPPAYVQNPISIFKIPTPPLGIGEKGTLLGSNYRVESHAKVQIAEVGSFLVRHEYLLRDADGGDALLIYGWTGGKKEWWLFTPLHAAVLPTPLEAGRAKLGETMLVGGTMATVTKHFRSKVLETDATHDLNISLGETRYGLIGQTGTNCLLARWDKDEITFSKGTRLKAAEVINAFK